jgi:quinol monooxygenase YgiN
MADHSDVVSIHPYFKIHAGKVEEVKALLQEFVAKVENEVACLYYNFTMKDDELFCREAYVGAAGALAHIENVGAELDRLFALVELTRVELHGPAAELEKLKGPLAGLNPTCWEYQIGLAN